MSLINELWHRRALIWNFAVSDLKIRYRNSILGFFWTVLEPLFMLAVLYIVFTNLFPSAIENFGMYLLLGIILWNTLSRGTEISLNSISGRSGLVNQIYFPREVPAISSTITAFLMLFFELIVFFAFMIFFKFIPPVTMVFLPFIILLEFLLIVGISLPLSVLNVRFKDMQFIWRIILQAGFFLTPIFYTLDKLPEDLRSILLYLPMTRIVEMAHQVAIFGKTPSLEYVEMTLFIIILTVFASYLLFRSVRKRIIEEL